MAIADTAKLIVDLSLKGNFATQLKATERSLASFDKKITDTQGRAYKAGQQIATGIKTSAYIAAGAIGFLATQVGFGLRSLSELESIVTQTNAVLKSTGGVAGQTADSVRKLAEQYESINATIDDKLIQSGENLLLTFTNIRKEAFEPALKAALDMNTALGRGEEGLQGTIQQLGVALNDPIKGLTRLQRAGITFTKVQKDQITAAVEAGDTFKAQGIILAELNKRYGGSFLAGGATTTGKIAKFKDAIEDLQKALASALLPTIGKVADRLSSFLQDPKVIKTIEGLGESIASLFSDKNLAEGGKILGTLFETAKAAAPVVGEAAKATLTAVKAAVSLFTSLPKEVQQLAIGAFAINKITGGLVTNLAGGLISNVLKQLVSGVVNVQGGVVNVAGAGGIGGAVGGAAKGKLGNALSAVGKVFLVGAAVGVFAELKGILDEQSGRNKEQAAGLSGQTAAFVKVAGIEDMKRSLDGIEKYEAKLSRELTPEAIAFNANIDGVKDAIHAQQNALRAAITEAEGKSAAMQVHATERAEAIASQKANAAKAATDRATMAVRRVEAAENRSPRVIAARIEAARRAQVAAANRTTAALKSKDFSVAIKNIINIAAKVSLKGTTTAQAIQNNYYNVPS